MGFSKNCLRNVSVDLSLYYTYVLVVVVLLFLIFIYYLYFLILLLYVDASVVCYAHIYVYMKNLKQEYQTVQSENTNGTDLNKRYGEIMDKPAVLATYMHIHTNWCLQRPYTVYRYVCIGL